MSTATFAQAWPLRAVSIRLVMRSTSLGSWPMTAEANSASAARPAGVVVLILGSDRTGLTVSHQPGVGRQNELVDTNLDDLHTCSH